MHNITADQHENRERVSYTTIDVTLVKTTTSTSPDYTSYAEPNPERAASPFTQNPIITDMDDGDEEDEEEQQVRRLLGV